MKTKHLFAAAAALALCAACQDFDPGLSDTAVNLTEAQEKLLDEYTRSFVARYGAIAPNHTWGFGEMGVVGGVATRSSNTNSNQWAGDPYHLVVPGYPFVPTDGDTSSNPYDGKYMVVDGSSYKLDSSPSANPAGDVTDEEIEYVSKWFRSHKNPTSLVIHWTDFFIQDISADKDRDAYPTWTDDANGGDWSGNVGNEITHMPWTDAEGNKLDNQTDRELIYGMDHLCVKTIDYDWDHTNNFNHESSNKNPLAEGASNNKRTIIYYTSSGTENFEYKNSDETSSTEVYHPDRYTIQHLTFTGASGKKYDGYYIGFDYECKIIESDKYVTKEADGYYNNWICKITPALPIETEGWPKRVMCEDLGNTDDFDFDDVVFDVYYKTNEKDGSKYDAVITLQAAGGTMPIYVGKLDENYEAHKLLDNASSVPVNVGGVKHEVAIYRLEGLSTTNPDDIPIYVKTTANAATTNITLLPAAGKGSSKAPQKFCVPSGTRWMRERQQIETGYDKFDDWVSDPSVEWWKSIKNSGVLY